MTIHVTVFMAGMLTFAIGWVTMVYAPSPRGEQIGFHTAFAGIILLAIAAGLKFFGVN